LISKESKARYRKRQPREERKDARIGDLVSTFRVGKRKKKKRKSRNETEIRSYANITSPRCIQTENISSGFILWRGSRRAKYQWKIKRDILLSSKNTV